MFGFYFYNSLKISIHHNGCSTLVGLDDNNWSYHLIMLEDQVVVFEDQGFIWSDDEVVLKILKLRYCDEKLWSRCNA